MTTFNELMAPRTCCSLAHNSILAKLSEADRPYMDDGKSGNYLQDFLKLYGEYKVCPIHFPNNGDPTSPSAPVRLC